MSRRKPPKSEASGLLGPATISDFDGTLINLDIDWAKLRNQLGINSLTELWSESLDGWDLVTRAEVIAAGSSTFVTTVISELHQVEELAILTDNSIQAVDTALERLPWLKERVRSVVGREVLLGSKWDPAIFTTGFELATSSLLLSSSQSLPTYVGDSAYELEYARSLGSTVFEVRAGVLLATDSATDAPSSIHGTSNT